MKKLFYKIPVIVILILFSTAFTEIVDVKPVSPAYPHVLKVVNEGLMDTDTEGKFNGAISVSRYDIAIFGSRLLDYLYDNYMKKIETLNASLTMLENEKLPERVYTLENFIFSLDADYKNTKNNVMELNDRVMHLENAITFDSTDVNNPLFKAIAQNAYKIAENKSIEKINELYETTLATMITFSNRMDEFENAVENVLDQFSKTKEYMTNTLDEYLNREKNNYKTYIDELFEKEKDGLKLYITNEISTQLRWKNDTNNATINQLVNEINNLKNEIYKSNEYIDNIIQQKFDFQVKPLISLTSKIPELDSKINELNDKIENINNNSSNSSNDTLLLKKINSIETDVNSLKVLSSKVEDLEKIANSYSAIINDASNRINNLDSRILDLEKQKGNNINNYEIPKDLLNRISIIEERLNNMKVLETAASTVTLFDEEISNNKMKINSLEEKIKSLEKLSSDFILFNIALNNSGMKDINELLSTLKNIKELSDDLSLNSKDEKLKKDIANNAKSILEINKKIDKLEFFDKRLKLLESAVYSLNNLPSEKEALSNIIDEMVLNSIMKNTDNIKEQLYLEIKDELIKTNMKSLDSIISRLNLLENNINSQSNSTYLDEKIVQIENTINTLKTENNEIKNKLEKIEYSSNEINYLNSKVSELENKLDNNNLYNNLIYSLIGGIVAGIAVYVIMGGL
ncbi:hypothetical protein [Marinitoga litoralis]|uniref:hypothetical protein n=1 Tax=Marinitoga litoralis TaxID=570855 RepID=UPI00195F4D81|nr:hypothetical protein [Marinitoga litoralis]MBM7559810.1 uncharacterized coiled-coil DUF342 family protein [Marinitoga litoralis]